MTQPIGQSDRWAVVLLVVNYSIFAGGNREKEQTGAGVVKGVRKKSWTTNRGERTHTLHEHIKEQRRYLQAAVSFEAYHRHREYIWE